MGWYNHMQIINRSPCTLKVMVGCIQCLSRHPMVGSWIAHGLKLMDGVHGCSATQGSHCICFRGHWDTDSRGSQIRVDRGYPWFFSWNGNMMKRWGSFSQCWDGPTVQLLLLKWLELILSGCITGWWWLVAIKSIFPLILGISSSQLTNSYFSEGWPNHQPDQMSK